VRFALIDADILAYQAAAVSETPIDWENGMWTLTAFEQEAINAFESTLKTILSKVEATQYVLAFSDSENWRKKILPSYKSNRSGVRRPLLLKFLREYAQAKHMSVTMPTLEGDDVIGIYATYKSKLEPVRDFIICSLDKDFKTIPGSHYNFGRDEFFEITEHQADYWHMVQTLTGDSTDGYTGCPGCGPKTAEKILKAALDEGTPWANPKQLREIYWQHVLKAYEKAGFGEEEALTQARVARILRAEDYDDISKKVILWTP
jgi:5'-3' exonuclease